MDLLRGRLRKGNRPCRRLMVLAPPQHIKSTLTSQLFPSSAFSFNPALKLILLSYSASLAESHALAARDAAELSGVGFSLNPKAKARNDWRTSAGGYLISGGIRGTVTGRSANGVIIDDPIKGDEEAMSPTIREKIWRAYSSVVETRLSPRGWVVLIQTPWHDEDLRGKLLATEPDDWLVLRFPALCDDPASDPLHRPMGASLWPTYYRGDWYTERRRHLEERGLIHQWHSLYQCDPKGDGTPREFAQYCPVPEYLDQPPGATMSVLACDPSKSKDDKVGDYAAFTLTSVDRTEKAPHLWVQSWALRTSANEVSNTAVALIEQYRPTAFAIETTMFQSLFYDRIFEAVKEKGLPCRLFSYTAPQALDKKTKIRVMLGHFLQQKRLHLHQRSPATRLYQQMLSNFPHPKEHDDLPDSQCMGLWLLRALGVNV